MTTNTNNLLSAADLFSTSAVVPLAIPELAGPDGTPRFVHVKRLSAGDALRFYATQGADVDPEEKRLGLLEMIACALVNEDGSRLIHESDFHRVGEMPMFIFKRIVDKVNELSGIGVGDKTATTNSGDTAEGKG